MPKSLCLGWSCETGPSCNITTVMVFQNSTWNSHVFMVCQKTFGIFIVKKCHCCIMKKHFLFPSLFSIIPLPLFFLSLLVVNCLFPFVFTRWGCDASRCSDRRQDHQGILFLCHHVFSLRKSPFSTPRPIPRLPPSGHSVFLLSKLLGIKCNVRLCT